MKRNERPISLLGGSVRMDHKEAIRIHAVDRYLLGELTAVEREEFEEHFFSCGECSEDLHIGAILVDNSRAVLGEEFPDPVPASPGVPAPSGLAVLVVASPAGRSHRTAGGSGLPEPESSSGISPRSLRKNVGAAAPPQFTFARPCAAPFRWFHFPKERDFFEIGAEEVEPAAGGYGCEILDDRRET